MKSRFFSEADEWTTEGIKITAPENLEAIQKILEDEGAIVVEHWFYRGSSAPDRLVFDDYDDFIDYLNTKASAGDAINVWNFAKVCTETSRLVRAKCPDDQNRVPRRGAY